MRIENVSKNTSIAHDASQAVKFTDNFFGMIFKKRPGTIVFKTRFGIHSFFMRFPIDVVVLDETRRVVRIRKNLEPNKVFLWNPAYATVIEMPEGSIVKSRTAIGDFLEYMV